MNTYKKILAVILSVILITAFVPSFAFAANEEATLLFNESTASTVNEEDGWEWIQESLTLKFNNASVSEHIEFEEPIDPQAYYTVEFYGTSTLDFAVKGNYDTNITFKGAEDAVLNVGGSSYGSIYGGNIVFESGTINLISFVWGVDSIVINGGTLNIDHSDSKESAARGLLTHSDGTVIINGGKYNFYGNFNGSNEPAAIMVQNESMENSGVQGIKILGGDIYIKDACVGIGTFYRSILVDNGSTGSITFDNVYFPFFDNCGAQTAEILIESANFISEAHDTDDFRSGIYRISQNVTVRIGDADYTRVEAALASIPNELTGVSLGNIMALIEAKNAINYNLDCFEQEKVDEMADKLESVVQKILDEVPEEPSDPVDPPSDEPGDEEVSWFVKLIRAIGNIFKTVFSFLFGWIGK